MRSCVRTQPAQPGSGDTPHPASLPPALRAGGGEGRLGQYGRTWNGVDRTRSDPYHVCVYLNCSHQAVNGLWGEKKEGREEK